MDGEGGVDLINSPSPFIHSVPSLIKLPYWIHYPAFNNTQLTHFVASPTLQTTFYPPPPLSTLTQVRIRQC